MANTGNPTDVSIMPHLEHSDPECTEVASGRAAGTIMGTLRQAGTVSGKRAVDRAEDARLVEAAIARTHSAQVAKAASRSEFMKRRAGTLRHAAERAGEEGKRAGGREQLKGHFIEALDGKAYNAKNRLTGKRLVSRVGSTNPGYDANRIVKNEFAGAVQQKSSPAGTEKAIAQMEKIKPGSAKRGTLRVPRDHLAQTRQRAAGRIRVSGMDFTSEQAGSKLDRGLSDIAKTGSNAGSKVQAVAKGAAIGAAINLTISGIGDAGALKRGDIDGRDFVERRTVDAGEGATNAVTGIAAASIGGAAATAVLGTSAGAAAAASAGAAGTAALTAVSGLGAVGTAAGAVLGGVTVAGVAPVVVSGALAVGSGILVGKVYKRVRTRLDTRQGQRHKAESGTPGSVPPESMATTGQCGNRRAPGGNGKGDRRGAVQVGVTEEDPQTLEIQRLLRRLYSAPPESQPLIAYRLSRLGFDLRVCTPSIGSVDPVGGQA